MATVRFTHTASITAEARVERTWSAPGTGQAGTATITLARGSVAANPAFIDANGLSLIEVLDEGGCGSWLGVGMEPTFTQAEIVIPAVQVWGILGQRVIQRSGLLSHVSPGYVVSEALRTSLAGVSTVQLAQASDGDAPDIRSIEIDGRDPLAVLTEMMQTASADLHIDAAGGIHWCGPLANATRRDTLLVADGNFHDVSYQPNARERVQEVIATAGETRYTARLPAGDMHAWPAQATINVAAAGDVLVVAAHAELAQRNAPAITIEGSVGPELWSIRERDFIKTLVPWAGFTGISRWCRVVSRSLSDDASRMRVQLQVMQPIAGNVQTAGAGARQKPPQRPGRDGRGGSFLQRLRDMQRTTTDTRREVFRRLP